MTFKMLYIDHIHHYLSTDHLLTFSDLGIEWYSTGYYLDSNGSGDLPPIKPYFVNTKFRKNLEKCEKWMSDLNKTVSKRVFIYTEKNIYDRWKFTKEFADQFDVFFFNHTVENIINNLDVLKDKIVILNTFGMAPCNEEIKIGNLRALKKIVRVSNNEFEKLRTNLYGGHDAIIHGSVVPDEQTIKNWNGNKQQICTFSNVFASDQKRREHFIRIKQQCPEYRFLLYGSGNENEPLSCGFVNMGDKIKIMQDSRVHLVTGTPGSSCTYSLVESMIIGAPVVCYGQKMWQSQSYEPSKLFSHGEDILIGETPEECSDYINLLMKDKELCQFLSKNARKKAISIYGRVNIIEKWRNLFNSLGFNL